MCACFLGFGTPAFCEESAPEPSRQPDTPETIEEIQPQGMSARPLDGVFIEAVENYPNPRNHQLALGLGLYPFNAYYMGLLLNGSYLYQFSRKVGWEVLNVNYAYSVQNDLTTELADKYAVNPKKIKRLQFLISSNMVMNISNGKFVLLEDHIRYFRIAAIGGLGLASTNESNNAAVGFGLRFESFTNDGFSLTFDARNSLAVPSIVNYVTFTLAMAFGL